VGRGQGFLGRTPEEMTLGVAFIRAARRDVEDAALFTKKGVLYPIAACIAKPTMTAIGRLRPMA
jgi:hypothetical protein